MCHGMAVTIGLITIAISSGNSLSSRILAICLPGKFQVQNAVLSIALTSNSVRPQDLPFSGFTILAIVKEVPHPLIYSCWSSEQLVCWDRKDQYTLPHCVTMEIQGSLHTRLTWRSECPPKYYRFITIVPEITVHHRDHWITARCVFPSPEHEWPKCQELYCHG